MDQVVGFGEFDFNRTTGELYRDGGRRPLAPTPAKLLRELVEKPGELVTREDLWAAVWPGEYLDLDQRLNFCVYQLRQSLGDDATTPCIIQTLPRLGYRFLPEVSVNRARWTDVIRLNGSENASAHEPATVGSRRVWRSHRWAVAATIAISVFATTVVMYGRKGPELAAVNRSASPANDAYALAEYILSATEPNWPQAEEYLQKALEADSTFAPAYVALATIRQEVGDWPDAERFLNTALTFDPELPEAHQILGARRLFTDWDWDAAQKHLHFALENEKTRIVAHRLLAHLAIVRGNHAIAIFNADRARQLNPGDAVSQADAGWIHYWAGAYDNAVAVCQESLRLVGANPWNEACLLSAWIANGELTLAAEMARSDLTAAGQIVSATPDQPDRVLSEFYYWRLSQLDSVPKSHYAKARLEALVGRPARALHHLMRAAEERHVGVLYAASDPVFGLLANNQKFKELCAWVRSTNRQMSVGSSVAG